MSTLKVVYDTDEEESDNGEANSSDQVEDSGDELDRANEVSLVCYVFTLRTSLSPCQYLSHYYTVPFG